MNLKYIYSYTLKKMLLGCTTTGCAPHVCAINCDSLLD